jgi:hypothetical protein
MNHRRKFLTGSVRTDCTVTSAWSVPPRVYRVVGKLASACGCGALPAFLIWLAGVVAPGVALAAPPHADPPMKASPERSMEEEFQNPPREFSLAPFWAWNDTLVPETLTWQMDQMMEQGMYSAFMHARSGIESGETPYFSEGWWEAIRTCVEHGAENGFYTWLYDEDKWPSGSAGGRVAQRNPERNHQKALAIEEWEAAGPVTVTLNKPEARYLAAGQLLENGTLNPDTLTDLSALNGKAWDCPPGRWQLSAYTEVDYNDLANHMDPATVRDFIDITHEEYFKRFGEYFGNTIPGVFFDEIMNDAGKSDKHLVWAGAFAERFRTMHGYDLASYLPALKHDAGRITPRIRTDFYETFTKLYEEAWFAQLGQWCADHNIALTGHTVEDLNRYITQGDYMQTMRHLQIPLTDNEDFRYTWPRTVGAWKPKQIASVGHLYGHDRIGSEALGGAGWTFTLDSARYGLNMLSAYGVNFHVLHLFHYSMDRPMNMDDWPQSWCFRNPYWKYFRTLGDQMRRVSYLITGGTPVVDVAVLYPQVNQYAGYGPGTTEETVETMVAAQIDTDVLDSPSLLGATIQDGRLAAGQMRYRAVVLPGVQCLRRSEADQLLSFARSGGIVLVHDRWPTDSAEEGRDDPYMTDFRASMEAAGVSVSPLEDTVRLLRARLDCDVVFDGENASELRYQHQRRDGRDIYFVVNGGRQGGRWLGDFRAPGTPALWDPEDGSITPLPDALHRDGRTTCTVVLDGWQGKFVVFDEELRGDGGLVLADTSLDEACLALEGNRLTATGWAGSGESEAHVTARVLRDGTEALVTLPANVEPAPASIALDGEWDFLSAGNQLDYEWRADVSHTTLELPVMRARWERDLGESSANWHLPEYDDQRWLQIAVRPKSAPGMGVLHYRSRWEARHISWRYLDFDLERFFAEPVGGKGLTCRKTLQLPPEVTGGWLAVVCASPFRVLVNGVPVGEGAGGKSPVTIQLDGFLAGKNVLSIEADDAQSILAEGQLLPEYGAPVPIFTDDTWEARIEGEEWAPAWVYLAAWETKGRQPEFPVSMRAPTTVWLRQPLPPGVTRLTIPTVDGAWQAWLDGEPLAFAGGVCDLSAPARSGAVFALRISIDGGTEQRGITEPVRVQCVATPQSLGSWTEAYLDWYSGRAVYTREFALDEAYLADDLRLTLDLGRVCWSAEIWVNGELAGTRIWPPYRLDITDLLHPGKNRVVVVAANLLANQMRWDMFDEARTAMHARRWHDNTIGRDAWALESGLVGPVQIIPQRELSLAE